MKTKIKGPIIGNEQSLLLFHQNITQLGLEENNNFGNKDNSEQLLDSNEFLIN